MRIIIMYSYFFPAKQAGGPISSLKNLIQTLSKQSECSLVILTGKHELDGSKLNIKYNRFVRYSKQAVVKYCAGLPIFSTKKSCIFYINGLYSFRFFFLPIVFYSKTQKILAPRGMLHPNALSNKSIRKKIFLKFLKLLTRPNRISFHATNSEEQQHIKNVFGERFKIHLIKNISDTLSIKTKEKNNVTRLVSICRISYIKSIAEVIAALQYSNQIIEYHVYGFIEEEAYWERCISLSKLLPANISFKYNGPVDNDNIEMILDDADVYIQVSASENYGHSLVNALSVGVPIITGKNIPWQYLETNCAGLNIDIEGEAIRKAVDFFADLGKDEFAVWQKGATTYYDKYVKDSSLKEQYLQMFRSA